MAYQVTAARRRPRKFEDLLGQRFVAATVQKSIASKQIAPAYLFSGPRGCGKTSTARILAAALNCENGLTANPCGTCSSCKEIAAGTHLDVIEIDGASNTGVNDVRKIKDEILFAPNSARYKIYIIDEVHMLSTSAFNALLKTIEEPPAYVVFIFATTELHKVPATIKSRCQQFNFKLVSIDDLYGALTTVCAELNITAEDEALYWIAHQATGSVRDAYTLFDQVAAFSDGSIEFAVIQDKLGLTGQAAITALIDAAANQNTHEALQLLDTILTGGVSVDQCTVDIGEYMRSLLLISHGITKESVLGKSAARFSSIALNHWSPVQIERGLSMCLQLFKDLRFSLNPRYELELTIAHFSRLSDYVSQQELKRVFDDAQQLLAGNAAPAREKKKSHNTAVKNIPQTVEADTKKNDNHDTEEPEDPPAIAFSELQDFLTAQLAESQHMLSLALKKTTDWKLTENTISMGTNSTFDFDTLSQKKDIIQQAASNALGIQALLIIEKTHEKTEEKPLYPEKIRMIQEAVKGTIVSEHIKGEDDEF